MARSRNPQYRYSAIPVDADGDGTNETVYIARSKSQREAIREVANAVDPEAWIDIGETRSFPTKAAAIARASQKAPEMVILARRLSRGESR